MLNWTEIETFTYLAIAGGVAALLAISLYFLTAPKLKVPAIIACAVACLGAGVGLGAILLGSLGWKYQGEEQANAGGGPGGPRGGGMGGGGMRGMGGGGMGGGGLGGGGFGGMGGGGQRGGGMRGGGMGGRGGGFGGGQRGGRGGAPDYRTELAMLVLKLDEVTTAKPVTLNLTADQKKAIRQAIGDLLDKDNLSAQDAEKKLKAILKVLDKYQKPLEEAGYRWPLRGSDLVGQQPTDRNNPFSDELIRKHLKALKERLAAEPKDEDDRERV
jgi:hypothetical protein